MSYFKVNREIYQTLTGQSRALYVDIISRLNGSNPDYEKYGVHVSPGECVVTLDEIAKGMETDKSYVRKLLLSLPMFTFEPVKAKVKGNKAIKVVASLNTLYDHTDDHTKRNTDDHTQQIAAQENRTISETPMTTPNETPMTTPSISRRDLEENKKSAALDLPSSRKEEDLPQGHTWAREIALQIIYPRLDIRSTSPKTMDRIISSLVHCLKPLRATPEDVKQAVIWWIDENEHKDIHNWADYWCAAWSNPYDTMKHPVGQWCLSRRPEPKEKKRRDDYPRDPRKDGFKSLRVIYDSSLPPSDPGEYERLFPQPRKREVAT